MCRKCIQLKKLQSFSLQYFLFAPLENRVAQLFFIKCIVPNVPNDLHIYWFPCFT